MNSFNSRVISIDRITEDLANINFSVPDKFEFKPGQYVILEFEENGKKVRRPYSLASKKLNQLDLCVKDVGGPASKYLFNLKIGDEVKFIGPMGKFEINRESKDKAMYFVATGTGIAPFRPMINSLLKNKNKIVLIFGNKTTETSIYDKEFQGLAKSNSHFSYYNVLSRTEDKKYFPQGHVQDFLDKFVKNNSKVHFYLCGMKDMINSCVNVLKEKAVQDNQIFYERYD